MKAENWIKRLLQLSPSGRYISSQNIESHKADSKPVFSSFLGHPKLAGEGGDGSPKRNRLAGFKTEKGLSLLLECRTMLDFGADRESLWLIRATASILTFSPQLYCFAACRRRSSSTRGAYDVVTRPPKGKGPGELYNDKGVTDGAFAPRHITKTR